MDHDEEQNKFQKHKKITRYMVRKINPVMFRVTSGDKGILWIQSEGNDKHLSKFTSLGF